MGSLAAFDVSRRQSLVHTLIREDSWAEPISSQLQLSGAAALIGRSMPESYPEEHLQRAQILLHGSSEDAIKECLSIIIYKLSNNIDTLFDDEQNWTTTMELIRTCGMLNLRVDREDIRDLTIRAFMDSLLRAVIDQMWVRKFDDEVEEDWFPIDVIKWLLSSGQDPDTPVSSGFTPLFVAAANGNLNLMVELLEAGADVNRTVVDGLLSSPLMFALEFKDKLVRCRMAKVLLKHGTSVKLTNALHLAISKQDFEVAHAIIQQGANLYGALSPLSDSYSPIYEDTALSVAAAAGELATRFVLGLLTPNQFRSLASFITADVFIAAADRQQDSTIRLLHAISAVGNSSNYLGITPMHVAAGKGHLSTCQLLLELYGQAGRTSLSLPLMHIATCGMHKDIVQLLLAQGQNPNSLAPMNATLNPTAFLFRCGIYIDLRLVIVSTCSMTALEMLMATLCFEPNDLSSGTKEAAMTCMILLISAGARLVGGEVVLAANEGHVELLSAALIAGGNPNEKNANGVTALQLALSGLETRHPASSCTGDFVVALLLENGAELLGGEIVQAVFSGHWSCVDLLLGHDGSLFEVHNSGLTVPEAAIWSGMLDRISNECFLAYDAGALCAAVYTKTRSVVDRILASRPLNANANILEATAIGLAAWLGEMDTLKKLVAFLPLSNVAIFCNPVSLSGEERFPFWHSLDCVLGSPLALAAAGKSIETFSELLERGCRPDRHTWDVLGFRNDLSKAQILIDNGHRLSSDSATRITITESPLSVPINRRNKELVLLLLKAGADVNEHDLTIASSRSPLQRAVEMGDLDMVGCLIQAGADVNAQPAMDCGATALQLASIKGFLGLAKQLLDWGANVNAPKAISYGRTALEGAAEHGRLDMLQLLLCHGALTTGTGLHQYIRSVQLATEEEHHEAAELLRRFRDWTEQDEELFEGGFEEEISFEGEDSFLYTHFERAECFKALWTVKSRRRYEGTASKKACLHV